MADNQKIVLDKLVRVQQNLKAPKGQFNSFGKYSYRSCEDILEAVKPLVHRESCVVLLNDEVIQIGEKYFIKATAKMADSTSGQEICNYAFAELDNHKGMSAEQSLGSCSSYARKYALNGLFAIDDTKDADTDEHHKQTSQTPTATKPAAQPVANAEPDKASPNQIEMMYETAKEIGVSDEEIHEVMLKMFHKEHTEELTKEEVSVIIDRLQKKKGEQK